MTDIEKQESQKTVVAFITGLLVGGLLVWVFSSTPEEKKQPTEDKTTTEEQANTTDSTKEEIKEGDKKEEVSTDSQTTGEGFLTVEDQKAGTSVILKDMKAPTSNGWVVVREYSNNVAGRILGAARYSVTEGLMPTSVELMRASTAGNTYQVVFYTNDGGKGFDTKEDKLIDGTSVIFKAN